MKSERKNEIRGIITERMERFKGQVDEASKCVAYMERQMATLQLQMTKQQDAHNARIKFYEERLNRLEGKKKWWKK